MNATKFTYPEFAELDCFDRLSFQLARWLYSTSVSPQLVTPVIVVSVVLLIVVVGSYSSLAKPREALDSNVDRENPNWDPTDNDGSSFIKSSKMELEILNHESLSVAYACFIPVMTALTLYLLNYCLNNMDRETLLKYLNWYILLATPFSVISVTDYITTVVVRRATHWLGKDSSAVLKRHRFVKTSDADTLPLGVVEHLEASTFKKDNEWFEKFKIHLRKEGVKIVRPKTIKKKNQPFSYVFDSKYLVSVPVGLSVAVMFHHYNPVLNGQYPFSSTNWIATNILGINFAVYGIKSIKVSSFKVAFGLLTALFFYDIYFVFGNKIMTKVATGIDLPFKICIPLHSTSDKYHDFRMSLLGLGDIVLPGTLLALCLRFDLSNFHRSTACAFHHLNSFPTPYFIGSLVSYTIGLMASYGALSYFKVGQPALLYIVPCMIFGISILALIRGEFKQLLSYNEQIEDFDPKKEDKKQETEQQDNSIIMITTDEDSSEDDNYLYEHPNDSYDEWEAKVELKRLGTQDLHNLLEELIDDDDEDDTFLINSDPESGDELDELELVELDEIELFRLQNDLKQEPREWYSDDDDDADDDNDDEDLEDEDEY